MPTSYCDLAYSVDFSAGFDMVRVDVFLEDHLRRIPDYLLWLVGDFLSSRSFYVERNGDRSKTLPLNLGWAQGSVLGPILFNMYMSKLPEKINAGLVTTYADDTYVLVESEDWQICKTKASTILEKHLSFLQSKG